MSGVLQFSLGLTAGGFASALANANSKLKGFVGTALSLPGVGMAVGSVVGSFAGLHAVVEGVMASVEKGAGLEKLAKQTGESVATMYQLQKALQAVDVDAGMAGGMVFRLQQALGGVNDQGEPTGKIFAQLGLSIDKLRGMQAPQALLAIGDKLNQMDAAGGMAAAGKIFGRFNAREFMMIARESKDFRAALAGSAQQAALFQRAAGSFDAIDKNLAKIKGKASGLFAGIAVGLAPALENITAALAKIDLTGIGEDLGKVITAFTQAWKEGKLVDLIAETFKVAFDVVVGLAPASFAKLGIVILKAFEGPLMVLQGAMEALIQNTMEGLGSIPGVGSALGLSGFKAESMEDIARARLASGAEFFEQGNNLDVMNQTINEQFSEALAGAKGRLGQYMTEWINPLAARAPKAGAGSTGAKGGAGGFEAALDYKMERTNLEKMGFVMRGGAASDPASQTAKNTAALVDLAKQTLAKMGGSTEVSNANLTMS